MDMVVVLLICMQGVGTKNGCRRDSWMPYKFVRELTKFPVGSTSGSAICAATRETMQIVAHRAIYIYILSTEPNCTAVVFLNPTGA